ncbi:hypothetical protein RN51_01580 [Microbacterium oxydans]|jgi:hypothetical protein|uniref:Uncharacterized protein n=1 Tax=Microbacterium oxydans TaxID=82380 RepID=A0A0F0KSN1_9MICO|nr:hypothetical protein [Microbacterium oxydans]KJL23494.1 hypothetical protein RN51_01580 [Microbacterium oxydans]
MTPSEARSRLFEDSWDRLAWVERQIEEVRVLCEPWLQLPRKATMTVYIDEAAALADHLEFIVDVKRPPPSPPEVNFLIGNIVTDARSCLDMAIQAVWNAYELGRGGRNLVQFPLEDDFAQKARGNRQLSSFMERLDSRFAEVIERAQPNYHGGMVDIPSNLAAIFINKLSNANKHRNITPAVVQHVLSSTGTSLDGIALSLVDGDERPGIPPLRFALDFDGGQHSEHDARTYIQELEHGRSRALSVHISQRLVVDRQEIPLYPPRFGNQPVPWRTELVELLQGVPRYVRSTLRNLDLVHAVIQSGEDDFYFLE